MAECPNCKREWLWDWDQDYYRMPDGTPCHVTDNDGNSPQTFLVVLECLCFQRLGIMRDGGLSGEPPEWSNIDWDSEEHAYDGQAF